MAAIAENPVFLEMFVLAASGFVLHLNVTNSL